MWSEKRNEKLRERQSVVKGEEGHVNILVDASLAFSSSWYLAFLGDGNTPRKGALGSRILDRSVFGLVLPAMMVAANRDESCSGNEIAQNSHSDAAAGRSMAEYERS